MLAGVIVCVGLLVAGIIFFAGRPPASVSASSDASSDAATSGRRSTCDGWTTVQRDFQAITTMPDGWTYNTPQIDMVIHARAAQLRTILDLFTKTIKPEPADVAAAAHAFVDKQSTEGPKLIVHTFGPADRVGIDQAVQELDSACGMR